MKKIIFGLGLALIALTMSAQVDEVNVNENGLVRLLVQQVAVPSSVAPDATAYRVFVELEPDYRFLAIGGHANLGNPLHIESTTTFFNETVLGTALGTSANPALFGTFPALEYDTYVTDGRMGTSQVYTLSGLVAIDATSTPGADVSTPDPIEILLDNTTNVEDSYDGWVVNGGVQGPASAPNQVFVAQFTVPDNGELSFNFGMISLINPSGDRVDIYNVFYPVPEQDCPTVSLGVVASPVSLNSTVTFNATASDTDGSVVDVEFFVNGISIGVDANDGDDAYSVDWTAAPVGMYDVYAVATDDAGCAVTSTTANFVVEDDRDRPVVSFTNPGEGDELFRNQVTTITVDASDADGTVESVEYSLNGAFLANVTTPPFSYDWTPATRGDFTLSAIATDNDGLSNIVPAEVNVTVVDTGAKPYLVLSQSAPCYASDIFCATIARDNRSGNEISDVIGFDIQMVFDPAMVTPTGIITVSEDMIADRDYVSYALNVEGDTMINIAVYLNSTAPAGTSFDGMGDLLCVEFARTIAFGSDDQTEFELPSVIESYSSGIVAEAGEAGTFSTYSETIFTGKLTFWADNNPIQYDVANPSDFLITNITGDINPAIAVQPDLNGEFEYDITNGTVIQINRDIAASTDVITVINSMDAYRTAQVLVNDLTFMPNVEQMIAMDVNRDQVVTAGDLSQIMQRTVLILDEFAQVDEGGTIVSSPTKDWLFVDPDDLLTDFGYRRSANYPYDDGVGFSKYNVPFAVQEFDVPYAGSMDCPIIEGKTYKGIMVGDVDGSYKSIPSDGVLKSAAVDNPEMNVEVLVGNGTSKINFSIENTQNAIGIDFRCAVPSSVKYLGMEKSSSLYSAECWIADDDNLRLTGMSLNGMDNNTNLISVSVKGDDFNQADFEDALAMINGESVEYSVSVQAAGPDATEEINVDDISIYPVPARDELNVVTNFNASVVLYNTVGVKIEALETVDGKVTFNVSDLAEGLYIIKIVNGDQVEIFNVVIE